MKLESGERKERTEWHRIVLWGKQAESLQEYLTKGKQVLVDGALQTRKWQDKDCHDRPDAEDADAGSQAAPATPDDSDIPF